MDTHSPAQQLWTDRSHLTARAYADGANLQARADIYRFQKPQVDLAAWVFEQVDWAGVGSVLDIGCGPGTYLKRLAQRDLLLLGMDVSSGMVREVRSGWPALAGARLGCAVADAQHIPVRDGALDAVLAMHMLYHVPNIEAAAREFRRVLRSGGRLYAATNSSAHMREVLDLVDQAQERLSPGSVMIHDALARRFRLEDGALPLGAAFEHVERREVKAELVIPEIEPVLRYLHSMRATREPGLPAGVTWEALMAEAQQHVAAEIARSGAFRAATHTGMFVCW
jgi:SAM-dependent methyltransferase